MSTVQPRHPNDSPPGRAPADLPAREGEMARRVRETDWSQTPLGPAEDWPQALRVAVGICLNSRFPMFVWWGPDLINIYNDTYAPMLGKRHPHALGRPARQVWADIWDVVGPQAHAVMARGEATWNERVLLVMERNGYAEDTYFTWSYSPIPDGRGGIGGVFCACTEETQRVAAEAAAREAELRYRGVFDAVRDALIVYAPAGTIVEANPAACRIYGYAREQLVGLDPRPAIHPDARPAFEEFLRVVGAGGEFRAETTDRRRDGTPFPIEVVGTPLTIAGRPHLMAIVRDVSERKRAEERARSILESVTDAFLALDLDWRFTYVNRQADRVLGRPAGDLLGRVIWDEYPGLLGTEFERVYRRAGRDRQPGSATAFYPDHDRWYEVHAYPATDGGVSVYFRDVSDRKRAEQDRERLLDSERAARAEAERASRLKDEFLATVSHELRTPLSAILGYAQLLRRDRTVGPEVADGLAVIERNARAQAQIIEDILDMSRVVSGKLRLDVRPLGLHEVVGAAVETVRPAAAAKHIRLATTLDPGAGPVLGDPDRLQQVIWNLLANAIKFTPADGRVEVGVARVGPDVELSVRDTGQGIRPEFLPHVFEKFRQGEAATTRTAGGLGLGLSIVKHLVELHGGTVRADSAGAGRGATFVVSLPAFVGPAGDAARDHGAGPAGTGAEAAGARHPQPVTVGDLPSLTGLSVLVVDDEPDARALARRLLAECGAEVLTAGSADEALSALDRRPDVSVILSDIGMPGTDGYTLIRQVRSRPPDRGGTVPAAAVTAFARTEDRARALQAGFQMHVTKPLDPGALVAAVANLAGRARPASARG